MTRKCHNHRPQTNPGYRLEDTQSQSQTTDQPRVPRGRGTEHKHQHDSKNTIEVQFRAPDKKA